jgi:hypothetical protein
VYFTLKSVPKIRQVTAKEVSKLLATEMESLRDRLVS